MQFAFSVSIASHPLPIGNTHAHEYGLFIFPTVAYCLTRWVLVGDASWGVYTEIPQGRTSMIRFSIFSASLNIDECSCPM